MIPDVQWPEPATSFTRRSAWGPGQWDHEPDSERWTDPKTGWPCCVVRNGLGAWCGYVRFPVDTRFPGLDQQSFRVEAEVTRRNRGEDGFMWAGLSCSHAGDLIPADGEDHHRGVYRDIDEAKQRVSWLVEDIHAELRRRGML